MGSFLKLENCFILEREILFVNEGIFFCMISFIKFKVLRKCDGIFLFFVCNVLCCMFLFVVEFFSYLWLF